jgi:hypothetical protein
MKNPFIFEVGRVSTAAGPVVAVGVNRGTVTINAGGQFTAAEAEEFAQLFVRACWQAAAQTDELERGARMKRISEFRR